MPFVLDFNFDVQSLRNRLWLKQTDNGQWINDLGIDRCWLMVLVLIDIADKISFGYALVDIEFLNLLIRDTKASSIESNQKDVNEFLEYAEGSFRIDGCIELSRIEGV